MKLTIAHTFIYSATWTPGRTASQMTVSARATAAQLGTASSEIVGSVTANRAPSLSKNGTLNNLNPISSAPIAPGAIVQLFGSDLAPAVAQPDRVPLATQLNGTRVFMGSLEAPFVLRQRRADQRAIAFRANSKQ
ncbi:MAG: hypothetical protein ABIZ80_18510 [Bryobacteraceae bacterium]